MSIATPFGTPFYEGIGSSSEAGVTSPVALGGRAFGLDYSVNRYMHRSVDRLRQQADQSDTPGEQCVDTQTEILTQRGWLSGDDVETGDLALTLNHKTGLSEWQPVDAVHRYPAKTRRMLHLDGKVHSSLTTAEHRWPVLAQTGKGPTARSERRFRTSQELTTSHRITAAAPCASLPTEAKYEDALVELTAWYWTEGNETRRDDGSIRRLTISQSNICNGWKCDRIRAALTRLYGPPEQGVTWYEYAHPAGHLLFHITAEAGAPILDALSSTGRLKVVSPQFISALTAAQLELFIETSVMGDGTDASAGKTTQVVTQKLKPMLDTFQMACVLAGRRNSMISYETPYGTNWHLNLSKWHGHANPIQNAKDTKRASAEWVEHDGPVWCVSTANQTWLARRRGTVYFTGNSINPEGLWRRVGETWHAGSGQDYFDRKDANPFRFKESQGIDPSVRYEFSLLHGTERVITSTAVNIHLSVAGDYAYWSEGADAKFRTTFTGGSTTTLTGGPAADVDGMVTDGYHVWFNYGASGAYRTTRGAAAMVSCITGAIDTIGLGKGRVLATSGPSIYDVTVEAVDATPPNVLPAALFTHPNPDFQWTHIADGPNFVYAAGQSGDKSSVYRIGIKDDGTSLTIPVPALPGLPDGEYVTALYSYLGFVFLGTSKGLRFASTDGNGDLSLGALIEGPPVQCFEGQGRFVWYGWTNFNGTSTGLGRLDLSVFGDTDRLVPAYWSDLMDIGQGDVTGVVTHEGKRLFAVAGRGLIMEVDELVESGWVDTGAITFSMSEPKIGLFVDLRVTGPGEKGLAAAYDGGGFVTLTPPIPATQERTYSLGEERASSFALKPTLYRDSTSPELGPTLHTWLLRATPASTGSGFIEVPLLLAPTVVDYTGAIQAMDTVSDFEYIRGLYDSQRIVRWQEGQSAWTVVVDGYEFFVNQLHLGEDGQLGYSGTCVVKLKVVI